MVCRVEKWWSGSPFIEEIWVKKWVCKLGRGFRSNLGLIS